MNEQTNGWHIELSAFNSSWEVVEFLCQEGLSSNLGLTNYQLGDGARLSAPSQDSDRLR